MDSAARGDRHGEDRQNGGGPHSDDRHSDDRHSDDRHSDDRHSDDELASALEEEVARITSAIPIVVRPPTEPAERISFDDLPAKREPTGPEPTFSPWVATAATPVQRAEPVNTSEPESTPIAEPEQTADPVKPPTFQRVARAEPLDLVPPDMAPRDSEPVPLLPIPPTPASPSEPEAESAKEPDGDPDQARDAGADAPAGTPASDPQSGEASALVAGRHIRSGILTPETTDLETVPVQRRLGRASRMFWLWFAGTSSLISVGVGATLFVLGLSLRQLLVATLVGVALSFLPLGLGTLAGKWSGQPTLVVSRAAFGVRGNVVPTVLALIVKLFWGAVLLWLAGSAAGSLTRAERWPGNVFVETSVGLAATIILAVAVAYVGYGLVARVQLVLTIASAVLIGLMVMATWRHVDMTRALNTPDALWTHAVTGAVLVFSYVGLAWAMSSAEVARYQRPLSSGGAAMLWATFGAAVPPFVLVSYGGLLAASNPGFAGELARDPVSALVRLGLPDWYPVPLLLAVGLSLVSALVLTLYSTGFTIDALGVRLGRRWSTVAAGVVVAIAGGVLAATVSDLSAVIRGVPTALSVPVAAWVGVFSGEMMLRTRRFHQPSLLKSGGVYPDWRWINLALLAVGTVVGWGTVSSPLPWLGWEGYLFTLVGIDPHAGVGTSNIGVLIALVIGLVGVLVSAAPAVRRQEQAAV
ncbi:cytosine permease [Leifsonia sp. 2MCAF36]|uniref:purine-cytosine permease family protein n=1 Tax=Leifsonia sp. 2MCAF36 TaxID=3232988 RepID=UPI003F97C14A